MKLPIAYDIQYLFEEEYKVGKYALKLVNDSYHVHLSQEEACYIAMHIINAEEKQKDESSEDEQVIEKITKIIERVYQICINKRNFNYSRFVTHMHYLLKRGKKQIELTDAGTQFYKRCLQILDLTEITKNELQQSYQDVLRIGITPSNSGLIQQAKISKFVDTNQHVQFAIYEGSTYEILDLLLSHNIDLGIVRTPFDTSKVNTYYLEKEPMVAIGKKEFFKEKISKMEDLKKIPLIIHRRYLPLINDYCLNKQIQIQLKVTCDDSRTSLIWANSGIGVAIIPQCSLALAYDSSLTYALLEDKSLYTGVAFITRKNESIPILLKEFMECFKSR